MSRAAAPADVSQTISPYIDQQLRAGKTRAAIADELIAAGWKPDQIRSLVANAPPPTALASRSVPYASYGKTTTILPNSPSDDYPTHTDYSGPASVKSQIRALGQRQMMVGGLWCVGGIIVTAVTYSAAANNPGGGTYVVFWGAILFGAIRFFRGLFTYMNG